MSLLWWHWVVLGLLLVVAEIAAPGGFYMIFFGAAALVVGVLSELGLAGETGMQLLLFSVLSVGSLLIFRGRLLKWVQKEPQTPPVDTLVGEVGVATEELAPGGVGRVELRGTAWSAKNAGSATLAPGSRFRVVRTEGLMLHVEAEGVRS